jgi:hypothetical protein
MKMFLHICDICKEYGNQKPVVWIYEVNSNDIKTINFQDGCDLWLPYEMDEKQQNKFANYCLRKSRW